MEWIKKHTDTVIIVSAIASSMLWMNGKFSDVDHKFYEVEKQIFKVQKEVDILKTFLIMRNVKPAELEVKVDEK